MNSLHIIGRLTADPEMRSTQSGKRVCSFTVAVNRKKSEETDFFRVSAWEKLAEICGKYLQKGRQVSVIGPVSVSAYNDKDGKAHGNLEIRANDVEFLGKKEQEANNDDLPWG